MTSMDREPGALLKLVCAGGPARPRRQLLDLFGSADAALAAGSAAWRSAGLDERQIRNLLQPAPASSVTWLQQPNHHLIGWHDPDYPALLRHIGSPPLALFVAGNPAMLWHPGIAVVGSRAASAGGRETAYGLSRELADSGLALISGLALGIDAAAHHAALHAGGITVAVLGSGIDVPYPHSHAGLMATLAGEGAVVSEYPPGTPPHRQHFPSRNRIVAGLALGTLVVEAAERSGALITARLAADCGREVFAVPGSIHNPKARGCHRLLRDGATLVQSAADIVDTIAPVAAGLASALRKRLDAPIRVQDAPERALRGPECDPGPNHHGLWSALGHDPSSMDQLIERTGLTAARVCSMLTLMELEGQVVVEHGRYSRTCAITRPEDAGRGQ